MATRRSGLGRNLSALLGSNHLIAEIDAPKRMTLDIGSLQPGRYQPRVSFDDTSLQELASSIQQQGVLQPLLVRAIGSNQYEIIAGERRWRASKLAGLDTVPVVLHEVDDETAMALALIENLQREDLNAIDEARAMHRLYAEFSLTHEQIADLLSKSRTAVTNSLRLLNLSEEVRVLVEERKLDMGHARCLLALDKTQQAKTAAQIINLQLSVRATEALVARMQVKKEVKKSPPHAFAKKLADVSTTLATKVRLKPTTTDSGILTLHYHDDKHLQMMLDKLGS